MLDQITPPLTNVPASQQQVKPADGAADILRGIETMCEGGTYEELNILAYIRCQRDGMSPNEFKAGLSAEDQATVARGPRRG